MASHLTGCRRLRGNVAGINHKIELSHCHTTSGGCTYMLCSDCKVREKENGGPKGINSYINNVVSPAGNELTFCGEQ